MHFQQWLPTDKLDIYFDYEFSDLEYTEKRMEFALDSRRDDLADHIISSDHTLLYATDDLSLSLDLSYSGSYRYRLRHRSKFRSTERYNYALDFRGRNVPTLTWLDNDRLGPKDSGFNSSEAFDASYMDNFVNDGHAYVEYRRAHEERNDDILALNFDGEYQLDNDYFSSIKAGIRILKKT